MKDVFHNYYPFSHIYIERVQVTITKMFYPDLMSQNILSSSVAIDFQQVNEETLLHDF
jgi:hypothetical protein